MKRNHLHLAFVAGLLLACTGFLGAQEIARNGDFSQGDSQWVLQLNGGGAGGKATAEVTGGVLHIGAISDVGSQPYSIQMIQSPVTIAKGVKYHMKVTARAAAKRTISVKIGGTESRSWIDYTGNGLGPVFELGTAMQTFDYEFSMKEPTDKAARIEFCFGMNAADVWVDSVSLVPLGGDEIRDGTLQNGDLSKGLKYWDTWKSNADWSGSGEIALAAAGGELSVAVTKVGSIGDNPRLQQTGLAFVRGKQYQVSFYARSTVNREMQVSVGADLKDFPFYEDYTAPRVIQLGAANQPYSFTFFMKAESNDSGRGRLSFNLGAIDGKAIPATVTLSKIEFRELDAAAIVFAAKSDSELVGNGNFETDTEGWTASGGAALALDAQQLKLSAPAGGKDARASVTTAALSEGGTYLLSLVIHGDAKRPADAALPLLSLKTPDGVELLKKLPPLVVDPAGKQRQYQVLVSAPADAESAVLSLQVGAGQTLWFDRVSLRPTGAWMDAGKPVAERVALLMAQMSVADKAAQMVQAERAAVKPGDIKDYGIGSVLSGGGSVPSSNTPAGWIGMFNNFQAEALAAPLGIPLLYGIDAVHGHGNVYGATIFPHNIGLGATRNPALLGEIGRVTALEVAATGLNWTFGPCVAVSRDERWGRTYESYGESPELQTLLDASYIKGLQGMQGAIDWMSGAHVIATAKHFMGDGGAEWGTGEGSYTIDRGDIKTLDLAQLKALHGQGYVEAVKAGVGSVMASFNLFKGVHMHAHKQLLSGWLKAPVSQGGLGFEGFVIGDWDAMSLLSEVKGDFATKVLTSFNAGLDMSMEQSKWKEVVSALRDGIDAQTIDLARMDDAVRRILTVKFNAGIFDHPWALDSYADQLGTTANRAVAAKAVKESLVLLKNDKDILPLKPKAKIFVSGPLADNVGWQSGGWTIQWQGGGDQGGQRLTPGTSILDGLRAMAKASGGEIVTDPARAKECSVAVAVVGETPYAEGVGDVGKYQDMDLASGKAASGNLEAIAAAKKAGLPVVVVLVSGRPLIITKELAGWNALVAAWLPGSEGGAIAEVLYGKENFKGKLPVTWPRTLESLPVNVGDKDLAKKNPLFAYGFGLSMKLP